MSISHVELELAREPAHPFGDREHVYDLYLPIRADGRIDGTLVKKNSHDWDLAAADLILARAGGALVDLDDRPLSYNRSTVVHGVLCAAAKPLLPGLIAASRSMEPH